ncbi:MAG: chemotaxis protein CheW [SAR202 cluster bacterium]|jgi:purine-binding chemotaxis protein CheW|nr:chemotaxis protein CheW [SAR202 cluster bacterium]MDP6301113.1 chemotaxis protein CheW [SAR202 cluster bacterium]MDP7225276.1 chemotaxis protein CheW [SAR202 cluster bacterium]MDP7413092.1 chemotaxis protein CheW [SAR202 cluster bacterium]
MTTTTNNVERSEEQLVVFDLAAEAFGGDIGSVRNIIRMQDITRVPGAPGFVEGIINLRGNVIPVIDLRKRFDIPVNELHKDNRIVVMDIGGQDMGVVVDAVTEVLRISAAAVEPPSSVITTADSVYLQGIVKMESRMVILPNLDKVLTDSEKGTVRDMAAMADAAD